MLDVEVTPRAAAQVETAAAWWAANRPAAPDAIRIDFQEAKSLLSHEPGVGARSSTARYPDLRRMYLSRVGYIYYRARAGKVVILAFWHASSREWSEPLSDDDAEPAHVHATPELYQIRRNRSVTHLPASNTDGRVCFELARTTAS